MNYYGIMMSFQGELLGTIRYQQAVAQVLLRETDRLSREKTPLNCFWLSFNNGATLKKYLRLGAKRLFRRDLVCTKAKTKNKSQKLSPL